MDNNESTISGYVMPEFTGPTVQDRLANDVFPLTWDNDSSEALGMVYVDDYDLFNRLLEGQKFILMPISKQSPYWLRVVPMRDLNEGDNNG